MNLSHRLHQLELKIKPNSNQQGCDVTFTVFITDEMQNRRLDSDSCRPYDNEIEEYLKHLKDSGQCRDCKGSCAVDWTPDGFKNHTVLAGGCRSSSPAPRISLVYCAGIETPELLKRIMNGEISDR